MKNVITNQPGSVFLLFGRNVTFLFLVLTDRVYVGMRNGRGIHVDRMRRYGITADKERMRRYDDCTGHRKVRRCEDYTMYTGPRKDNNL